jgi:hypothetical protein
MTIVDLSDLDTFIRDSLYEVRRGIANSRNATQANPMLGVMVDLPEKVDFEIMVTTAHQSLSRNITELNLDSSVERSSEEQATTNTSSEQANGKGSSSTTSSSNETGNDIATETSNRNEMERGNGSNSDSETKTTTTKGTDLVTETTTKTQTSTQTQTQVKTSTSRQGERHLEANDRASKSFDEDTGTWGGQGTISTPQLPGSPCSC